MERVEEHAGWVSLFHAGGWEICTHLRPGAEPPFDDRPGREPQEAGLPVLLRTVFQIDGDVLFIVRPSLLHPQNRPILEDALHRHFDELWHRVGRLSSLAPWLQRMRWVGVLLSVLGVLLSLSDLLLPLLGERTAGWDAAWETLQPALLGPTMLLLSPIFLFLRSIVGWGLGSYLRRQLGRTLQFAPESGGGEA